MPKRRALDMTSDDAALLSLALERLVLDALRDPILLDRQESNCAHRLRIRLAVAQRSLGDQV